jgi:hypothetical protein
MQRSAWPHNSMTAMRLVVETPSMGRPQRPPGARRCARGPAPSNRGHDRSGGARSRIIRCWRKHADLRDYGEGYTDPVACGVLVLLHRAVTLLPRPVRYAPFCSYTLRVTGGHLFAICIFRGLVSKNPSRLAERGSRLEGDPIRRTSPTPSPTKPSQIACPAGLVRLQADAARQGREQHG